MTLRAKIYFETQNKLFQCRFTLASDQLLKRHPFMSSLGYLDTVTETHS